MSKKQENPVGYRPGEKAKELFEEFCGENSVLSRSQLIEIAMKFLMMRPHSEMEEIIWGLLKGDTERVKAIQEENFAEGSAKSGGKHTQSQKKMA